MKIVLAATMVAILLGGCKQKFTCDVHPLMGEPERLCCSSCFHPKETFKTDHAYCFRYSRSRVDVALSKQRPNDDRSIDDLLKEVPPYSGAWSVLVQSVCFPTMEECVSFHDGVGTGSNGQPPVKSDCLFTPSEQDPTTSPM